MIALIQCDFMTKRILFCLFCLLSFFCESNAQSKSEIKTCLLQFCDDAQVEAQDISDARAIQVKSVGTSTLLQIVEYRVEILFRDDVVASIVVGENIPESIYQLFSKLDTGSEVRFKSIKSKTKNGALVEAPDLTIKIY